jgi:hypothetical protein
MGNDYDCGRKTDNNSERQDRGVFRSNTSHQPGETDETEQSL